MKTPEELKTLREEAEALNGKLAELNEDELAAVVGGAGEDKGGTEKSRTGKGEDAKKTDTENPGKSRGENAPPPYKDVMGAGAQSLIPVIPPAF